MPPTTFLRSRSKLVLAVAVAMAVLLTIPAAVGGGFCKGQALDELNELW